MKSVYRIIPVLTLIIVSLLSMAQPKSANEKTIILPGNVPLELIHVYPGTFLMGQKPGEQDAYPNKETPQHPVTLSKPFWMGKYEITKAQWLAVMKTKPWDGKRFVNNDQQSPAVYISWNDARLFAERLSAITHLNFRLPTEAEWEYTCRANTTNRFYWGDDSNYSDINTQAWWRGNSLVKNEQYAHCVGLLPPNPWGFYDISGNVSEWCNDWHSYYPEGPATDPQGPDKAEHRVLRGGSWISIGGHCRSSRRHHELPDMAHSDFGLRIALTDYELKAFSEPKTNNLFVAGTEGVNTYRIPSLILAPDNSLLAFCEARKESISDASPTDLILRRSTDGGNTWLPTQTLLQGKGNEAYMNPCPVIDHSNNRILFFCVNANKFGESRNQLLMLASNDNGKTWEPPVEMARITKNYDDHFVPGPGIGIQLKSGRLIIPGYVGGTDDELDDYAFSCVLYSDDHGKNWVKSVNVSEMSDESQTIELKDGTLVLNMRGDMGKSCRGIAESKDGGQSWLPVRWEKALNECPCQASIIRYGFAEKDGKDRILFANPDNTGERFGILERTNLSVRMSFDEGKTWPVKKLIHSGPSSYSTMVRLPDGTIGLLFEGGEKHRREWIRFVRFSLQWLTGGAE